MTERDLRAARPRSPALVVALALLCPVLSVAGTFLIGRNAAAREAAEAADCAMGPPAMHCGFHGLGVMASTVVGGFVWTACVVFATVLSVCILRDRRRPIPLRGLLGHALLSLLAALVLSVSGWLLALSAILALR